MYVDPPVLAILIADTGAHVGDAVRDGAGPCDADGGADTDADTVREPDVVALAARVFDGEPETEPLRELLPLLLADAARDRDGVGEALRESTELADADRDVLRDAVPDAESDGDGDGEEDARERDDDADLLALCDADADADLVALKDVDDEVDEMFVGTQDTTVTLPAAPAAPTAGTGPSADPDHASEAATNELPPPPPAYELLLPWLAPPPPHQPPPPPPPWYCVAKATATPPGAHADTPPATLSG